MSVINRRSRLVNFRLSEPELEALKSACVAHGARSISDFARGAVLTLMHAEARQQQQSDSRVGQLDQRMSDLEMRIALMFRLIETQYRNGGDAVAGRIPHVQESPVLGTLR